MKLTAHTQRINPCVSMRFLVDLLIFSWLVIHILSSLDFIRPSRALLEKKTAAQFKRKDSVAASGRSVWVIDQWLRPDGINIYMRTCMCVRECNSARVRVYMRTKAWRYSYSCNYWTATTFFINLLIWSATSSGTSWCGQCPVIYECVTWLIHTCDMAYSNVWHDSESFRARFQTVNIAGTQNSGQDQAKCSFET